jgi:hypothetical protein
MAMTVFGIGCDATLAIAAFEGVKPCSIAALTARQTSGRPRFSRGYSHSREKSLTISRCLHIAFVRHKPVPPGAVGMTESPRQRRYRE